MVDVTTKEVINNGGKIPETAKDAFTITGILKNALIDYSNISSSEVKTILKNSGKPLEIFIEAVDGKSWDQITGKMLGAAIDVLAFDKLLKLYKTGNILTGLGSNFGALAADKADFSAADYFEKAFPAMVEFWAKMGSDRGYAQSVLDELKELGNFEQMKNYYSNVTLDSFISDFRDLFTPLPQESFTNNDEKPQEITPQEPTKELEEKETSSEPKLEIAILSDTTGSMSGEIKSVKAQAKNIVEMAFSKDENARIGVFGYNDPNVQTFTALTNNKSAIISAINALYARDGGDTPEMTYKGIINAASSSWSPNADKKIIIFFYHLYKHKKAKFHRK